MPNSSSDEETDRDWDLDEARSSAESSGMRLYSMGNRSSKHVRENTSLGQIEREQEVEGRGRIRERGSGRGGEEGKGEGGEGGGEGEVAGVTVSSPVLFPGNR